ncbi:hypothetical protein PS057_21185, partial [Yersinia pestis]|nr:hypothetical protein [Yersinia pestis]
EFKKKKKQTRKKKRKKERKKKKQKKEKKVGIHQCSISHLLLHPPLLPPLHHHLHLLHLHPHPLIKIINHSFIDLPAPSNISA